MELEQLVKEGLLALLVIRVQLEHKDLLVSRDLQGIQVRQDLQVLEG
jgi:hypothetical protein